MNLMSNILPLSKEETQLVSLVPKRIKVSLLVAEGSMVSEVVPALL